MEESISPARLQNFARHLVLAAQKQQLRHAHAVDLTAHIEKIKKYARNPRIRKETLHMEINSLRQKIGQLTDASHPVPSQPVDPERQNRIAAVEAHLSQVDQRLLLDEQRRNAQLDLLVQRLDQITSTMGALCKRLHVSPPKPTAENARTFGSAVRGPGGRFTKRKLPPTQSVLSFSAPKQTPKPMSTPLHQPLIHSWTHKNDLELKKLRKQLAVLSLQYHNLKRRGKDSAQVVELGAFIARLKERISRLR